VALLVALAGLLLLATVSPASAEAPCWKRVTLDWADNGTVDKTYPLPCYTDAIDNMTTTMSLYSSFEEDIRRAQQRVIANQHGSGGGPVTIAQDPATSDDGGVPTLLIVLGGLAIVLVAVGAVGIVRKRGRDTA
jgi:hypothetical protein